ncbi:MAG: hypothetical protein ABIW94_12045 [Gemmatimonadaceae bacterium]
MQRPRNPEDAGVQEMKSDETHVSAATPFVELGAWGNELREQLRAHPIVQQRQVSPLGGKENVGKHRHVRCPSASPIPQPTFHPNSSQLQTVARPAHPGHGFWASVAIVK